MLSTGLEYLCTELECFLHGCNVFYRVAIPLYRVGMLSTGLEILLQGWNAFDRVGMLSTGLECFLQGWNTFVQSWNAFYGVGMLSTELEYLCAELEFYVLGWNAFDRV
jgi:hypothetical protein